MLIPSAAAFHLQVQFSAALTNKCALACYRRRGRSLCDGFTLQPSASTCLMHFKCKAGDAQAHAEVHYSIIFVSSHRPRGL